MKTVFKKHLLGAFAGCSGVIMLAAAPSAMALGTFPTTGTCAMLVSHGSPEGATVPIQIGYSSLATIDFSAGTMQKETTKLTYSATGPTVTANTAATKSLTVAAGSFGSSSRVVTVNNNFPNPDDTFNLIAVNGGNTLLVQGISNPSHGVCQF